MTSRVLETRLANFTLAVLALDGPLETWASGADGLTDPFYLVDVIGMLLLLWGAIHSRRSHPHSAPGLLAAGWGWTGANFWRATFGRVQPLRAGEQLDYGSVDMCVVACRTAVALECLALAVFRTARASSSQ